MILRILEGIHGHLGVAAAVALLHPAILLRRGLPLSRGARWSIGLTTAAVTIVFSLGIALYGSYRALVKRELFSESFTAGLAFETKEHLAFCVLTLALGAAVAALAAPARDVAVRRAAALVYAMAAATCFIVTALGTGVAAVHGF